MSGLLVGGRFHFRALVQGRWVQSTFVAQAEGNTSDGGFCLKTARFSWVVHDAAAVTAPRIQG